jgi:hypothetical protein
MKNNQTLVVVILSLLLAGCAGAAKRKTAQYYLKNETAILEMRQLYQQLYQQQPFSIGFTDKRFKYYVLEVTTDSLRYIYNNEQSEERMYQTIVQFNYDTAALRKLATNMKSLKCLWLDKASFYLDQQLETVTYCSFKSVAIEMPFEENKYYVLLFSQHPLIHPRIKERISKGKLVPIKDNVYFTIANKFR